MSPAQALLPDPALLVARLKQLGLSDAPLGLVTLPTMYSHTLVWDDASGEETLANAVVSAHVGNDGSGSLALVMTAYGDGQQPPQDAMQAPLLAILRSLYREAGLDAPKPVLQALQAPATDTPDGRGRSWALDGIHIELDSSDEDETLPTLTLSLSRPLSDAEWQAWLRPGGVLAAQAAQVREESEGVLARCASVLVAHAHPFAARAADMRVFLSMPNDEGGTRTIVQVPGDEGASLWCDVYPDGFRVHIVHGDGRVEVLE